jgi:beta-phosphoglucomutase-like phosphatase (HAD superfamily)
VLNLLAKTMARRVKAVVFDVGGVFRDSERAMHRCFTAAFRKHGLDFQFDPKIAYHLRYISSVAQLIPIQMAAPTK